MAHVIIVGGGPAGLSAGLFTAKNGLETTLFDTGKTWMHKAHLFNYLGIESRDGSQFVDDAREQVDEFGVERVQGEQVTAVEETDDGFSVATEGDDGVSDAYEADYVIFATGTNRGLAEELGCETTAEGPIEVSIDMETSVDDAYAVGATARAEKWQAIISAGDGAAAALDVLSKEEGEKFHDFDTPADAE
ncbi:FAD-dependent oxidoreductase [Natrononativus amylolyticus]|uniref:FAD-dependent oxidoreductase n=1 Tax=Natrononativus amylolyticus TaxID=2963434 RepID=UPI0020CD3C2D|nr:FAD-dependent oxidoreductase [Natrononativus amylolyticus]